MLVNKENLIKIIEDVKDCAWSYTSGDEKYLTNNGDVISIIGFVYEPIHEFFEPTYKLSLNSTLLFELNGRNGEERISGIFNSEDEAFTFLENYFKNREVAVSEINPINEDNINKKIIKVFKDKDSMAMIIEAPNGKFFNYYYDNSEDLEHYKSNAGSFETPEEAEQMLYKHRPNFLNEKSKNLEEETNMDKLNIKVELRKINKEDSNLKGFADITLAGVTIKDVAVKEIPTKEGKIVAFDMPNIDKYQDKEGNMKYIKSVSINTKKDNLIPEIRKALLEALTSNETNEYGKTVINHETNIEYDKDYVKSYIRPLSFENNPYIKATGRILVGGVLALNNVRLNEGISKEGNEFQSISVPEKKIDQEYKPLVYLDKDLRDKIKDNLVSEYNKETKEQEANNEEAEEDEI